MRTAFPGALLALVLLGGCEWVPRETVERKRTSGCFMDVPDVMNQRVLAAYQGLGLEIRTNDGTYIRSRKVWEGDVGWRLETKIHPHYDHTRVQVPMEIVHKSKSTLIVGDMDDEERDRIRDEMEQEQWEAIQAVPDLRVRLLDMLRPDVFCH